MSSRQRIKDIFSGKPADRCGLWLGSPHGETISRLARHLGVANEETARLRLGDDIRRNNTQFYRGTYAHPQGGKIFMQGRPKDSHSAAGPLADAQSPGELESFDWPDPKYLNFDLALDDLANTGEFYRPGGFWSMFFHDVIDLFGWEEFMVKLHSHPDVVREVVNRVCGFYLEANRRFLELAKGRIDALFIANDFGSQQSLLISPTHFDTYFLPWYQRHAELAHRFGCHFIVHSCGAIHDLIPRFIDAGVDVIHPLQAGAARMDAQTLARDFKGRVAFMGGIDTQDLLVRGTPAQVKAEVRRVKDLLETQYVVSPSHEQPPADIPPENLVAMAEAALAD